MFSCIGIIRAKVAYFAFNTSQINAFSFASDMPLDIAAELPPLPIEDTYIKVHILEADNSRLVALSALSISWYQQ